MSIYEGATLGPGDASQLKQWSSTLALLQAHFIVCPILCQQEIPFQLEFKIVSNMLWGGKAESLCDRAEDYVDVILMR